MTQTEIPQEFDILGSSSKWKPENLKPVTLFEMSSASPQINELAAALAKAQAKFTPAAKNKTNPHLKSKYADLVAVTEACKAPLAEAGLSYSQIVESERAEVTCVTVLMHSSGQWIAGRLTLHGKDTSPQAMGSAITYARRYGLSAMLGIVTDEEDDGDSAQAQPAKSKDAKYQNISVSEPKPAEPPKKPAAEKPADKSHEQMVDKAQGIFGGKIIETTQKKASNDTAPLKKASNEGAPLAAEAKDDLWDLVCQVWPSDTKHALNTSLKERKLKPVDFKTITVGEAKVVHDLVTVLLAPF